ncbi:MAG: hypothetical protein HN423_02485 [Alphaproteobacteria bacterium]|jgi:hypothetical protein|nr:hypothetical protein [Alphaproteobacteria bacterium]
MTAISDRKPSPPDWSIVDRHVAREIAKSGDVYLGELHKIAASIEARASTLTAVFSSSAVASMAVLGTSSNTWASNPQFIVSGVVIALGWFAAANYCVSAILPKTFPVPGAHPERWYESTSANLNQLLGWEAEECQGRIGRALVANGLSARRFNFGARLGVGVPAIGAGAWLLTSLVFWCV